MCDVQAEVPATDNVPSSEELLVHVLLYFLSDIKLVSTALHSVTNHMLGFELYIWFHFRVQYLYTPFV